MQSRKVILGSPYKQYTIYFLVATVTILMIFLIVRRWGSTSDPLVLVKREFFMDNNNTTTVPRKIHRTYSDKSKIPEKIFTNMRDFAPGYEIHLYDDEDCKTFLQLHFQPEVVDAFHRLKEGAHKADLFRYCVMYIAGGIYLDIKIELLQDISSLYSTMDLDSSTRNPTTIYTVLGGDKSHIFQGVIIAPPGQPIFLKLIDHMVANVGKASRHYHMFVQYFLKLIKEDASINTITPGKITGKELNYYLFKEIATHDANQCYDGLDRHGFCSYIVDVGNNQDDVIQDDVIHDDVIQDKRIFKTRYADYPW